MWQKQVSEAELARAFSKQLAMSDLPVNATVALLTDQATNRRSVDAAFSAVKLHGGSVYELQVREGTDDRHMQSDPFSAPGLVDLISKADLILCFFVGFFSTWEKAARANGARLLMVLDDPEQLVRLQTNSEVKKAVVFASQLLKRTRHAQVVSDAGTDLHWEIDQSLPISVSYGIADQPGARMQWGQGMVACYPVEGSARGRVVMQPGDVWILPYARMVQSTISLEISEGFVREVEGGIDAFAFKRCLDNAKTNDEDMDPFAISHLGWGMHPGAEWDDILRFENSAAQLATSMRSYPGNFLFSVGPSPRRKTRGHIDMPMNHCTVLLDGVVVVDKGRLIVPEMIVSPRRVTH